MEKEASVIARGTIAWLTGLSGAGKTTIARQALEHLRAFGQRAELLDGDVIRQELTPELGFSARDRNLNVARVAYVATLLAQHDVVVLVAMISPYEEARQAARARAAAAGVRFLEVYVHAPIEIVMQRDTKGLYRRAVLGELPHFTGVSDPYEEPCAPDLLLRTHVETIADSVSRLLLEIVA